MTYDIKYQMGFSKAKSYFTKILQVLVSFCFSDELSTILACLCDSKKPKTEPVCKSISVTKWPSIDNSVADTLATCQIEPLGVQRVQKGLKSQADILVARSAHPQSTRRVLGVGGQAVHSKTALADTSQTLIKFHTKQGSKK